MPIRAKLLRSASPSQQGDQSLGGESAAIAAGQSKRDRPLTSKREKDDSSK